MGYWAETKSWLAGLTFWRKLGMVFVLVFPALALIAWVLEQPSSLRAALSTVVYVAFVAFYVWQEVRVMSKVRGQPRPSIAALWLGGNTPTRIRLVVVAALVVAAIVIGAISGFIEESNR